MSNLQKLFDLGEEAYDEIQKELSQRLGQNDSTHYKLTYRENGLWRRHIVTIMASDKFSEQAKLNAVGAWTHYINAQKFLNQSIDVGVEDLMESSADRYHKSRGDLIAVMEAFGYDLEKESKQIESKIKKK